MVISHLYDNYYWQTKARLLYNQSMPVSKIHRAIKEITYKSKDRVEIFLELEIKTQAKVLMGLSRYVQARLVTKLTRDQLIPILEILEPDDATDVLQLLPKRRQKEVIEKMGQEMQNTLAMLLQFDPRTAAGLMSLNYILVDSSDRLTKVAEQVEVHEKRTGKPPTVLVIKDQELLGFIPLQNLLFTKPGDRAENVVKKIRTIKHTAPSERVIERFLENPHQKIVVLGENNAVMGVLYSDDVIRILQEREISSLYDFAGLSEEETVEDSIKFKVKRRYKWLIINLFTGFIVAFTVNLFDETISKYVLLAVYMPIVAGMGGNAATQTLAILVRGITLNQISLETAMPTLLKEVGAGLINGIINGVIVFAIVYLFNRDPYVGLVLAAAMIINLLVAGFFGTLVPLLMKRLGKDPATSATIFITTATDVLGFLAFLGLATLVLK